MQEEECLSGMGGDGDEDTLAAQQLPLKPDAFRLIKQTIEDDLERYAVWVCQAALGIDDPEADNPLLVRDEGSPVPLDWCYLDVAWILLEKLTARARPSARTFEGYCSISDWIAHQVKESLELNPVNAQQYKKNVARGVLIRDFFRAQLDLFEYKARSALMIVYHGAPLYRLNDAATSLELLPYTHEDYVYLSKKGQYLDPVDMSEFPFWTQAYYFKVDHLDAEAMFFHEDAMESSAEEISRLRDAYRRHIGIEATHGAAGKAQSSLLDLIPKVLERYYGGSYVATDPDTWTKQVVVINWLMSTFKISEREAAAIDIVTRPDHGRRKSR